jgi:hypothetical protein
MEEESEPKTIDITEVLNAMNNLENQLGIPLEALMVIGNERQLVSFLHTNWVILKSFLTERNKNE